MNLLPGAYPEHGSHDRVDLRRGARKITGENLKVILLNFKLFVRLLLL